MHYCLAVTTFMKEKNITYEASFYCDKCGLCCSHLELFGEPYEELNRGDGICIYFDEQNRLCKIYNNRPDICNVEKGYLKFFSYMDRQEYIRKSIEGCKKLKIAFKLPT